MFITQYMSDSWYFSCIAPAAHHTYTFQCLWLVVNMEAIVLTNTITLIDSYCS